MERTPDRADLAELVDARVAQAEATLRQAIELEVACVLDDALTRRFRARPYFLARTPPAFLVQLRAELADATRRLTAETREALWDLRIYLGATEPPDAHDDEAREVRLLADVVGAKLLPPLEEMLSEACLPGDETPDRADLTTVDLDASYELGYAPSAALVWAWRRARAIDAARNAWADAAPAGPPPSTFAWRYYFAEAAASVGRS